jgi:hypothetical protein
MAKNPTNNTTKQTRISQACQECRSRKIKCNGIVPCHHCSKMGYPAKCQLPEKAKRGRKAHVHKINPARTAMKEKTSTLYRMLNDSLPPLKISNDSAAYIYSPIDSPRYSPHPTHCDSPQSYSGSPHSPQYSNYFSPYHTESSSPGSCLKKYNPMDLAVMVNH